MGRQPPFAPLQLNDEKLDRLQKALVASFARLGDRVDGLEAPVVALVNGAHQITVEQTVDYRGAGADVIQLPLAASAGVARARTLYVLNNGLSSITIAAAGKDLVNKGSTIALEAGAAMLAQANGQTDWTSLWVAAPTVVKTEWYSPVGSAAFFFGKSSSNVSAVAGNFTVGDKFSATRSLVCTGVKFFWKDAGASKTVRVRLYQDSTSVASTTVSVSASGVYTGTFSSPFTINPYQDYAATTYETTGGFFVSMDATGGAPFFAVPIVGMTQTGPYVISRSFQRSAAGDVVPDTTSSARFFPVEPVFAPFSLQ